MEQRDYWDSVASTKEFTLPFQGELFEQYVDRDAAVLDVGCGYGRVLSELHGLGYRRLTGVDFSPAMIREGKARFPFLDLRVMTGGSIDLPDESVDAALLFAVLTCIAGDADQTALVSEIRRVLKPGGILYVNDYLLNTDARNVERYERFAPKFGTYGVFELPEGAICRHHTEEHIRALLGDFETLEFSPRTYVTMNGHTAQGFTFLGKKR